MKIMLIGFRGTGFRNPAYQNEPGLVKSGHVGVAFEDDPNTIYGFHPTKAAGSEDALISLLKKHERQAGTV